MDTEDIAVIEIAIFAIFYVLMALVMLIRVAKGPNAVDRALICDASQVLLSTALLLYSLFCGRAIYLDIALVVALLGFIGTVLVARYIGGRL